MQFSINKDVLLNHLLIVQRGLPTRTPLPILYAIKFQVYENELILTSSNTDIVIQTIINDKSINVSNTGSAAIPGKYLIDIVRKVNSNLIEFIIVEDRMIIIKSGRSEFKLRLMDIDDYPEVDFLELNNSLTLNHQLLKTIIKETSFATATSEKRPILTGVNLKFENNKLLCVATDSYRLSQKQLNLVHDNDFDIVIPNKSLDELNKILDFVNDDIEIFIHPNKVLFKVENIMLQTRLLEGNYPDTGRIIPTQFPVIIPFNKDSLLHAVERVSLLSPKERETNYAIIKLNLKPDHSVEISSTNNEVGDAVEEVIPSGDVYGPIMKIAFNARNLSDALKSFSSNEINLKFAGEVKPFIIEGNLDEGLLHLILPVRID